MRDLKNIDFINEFSELYSKNRKEAIEILELQFILSEIEMFYSPIGPKAGNILNLGIPDPPLPKLKLDRCDEVFKNAFNGCRASFPYLTNCFSIAYRKYDICKNVSSFKINVKFWNSPSGCNSEDYPVVFESYCEATVVLGKCFELIKDAKIDGEVKTLEIQQILKELKTKNSIMSL